MAAAAIKNSNNPAHDPRAFPIPGDDVLEKFINTQIEYPRPPYADHIKPSILSHRSIIVTTNIAELGPASVIHILNDITINTTERISVLSGSLVAGKNISLKAPIIYFLDHSSDMLRTTIAANGSLTIEADLLIVDGAAILEPSKLVTLKVGQIVLNRLPPNTQWIEETWINKILSNKNSPNISVQDHKAPSKK